MRNAVPVPVFDVADLREGVFAGEYVANSRPCVIRGAIGHWNAAKKWHNKEYLKYRCNRHKVFYFPHENHVTSRRMLPGRRQMGFAQAIDRLHAAETDVASLGLNRDMPELLPDLGNFPFFTKAAPPFFFPAARFFMYRNAGTAWHYHTFDETLMCQVVGSKKIGLLYTDTPHHRALCDIFLKEDYYDDAAAFDALGSADLRWFSATLEETDALYIPPLWWHGVIPVSASFGVTTALTWQSPPHVIAESLAKMASGAVDMAAENSFVRFEGLRNAARFLGLEQDLAMALQRLDARAAFEAAP